MDSALAKLIERFPPPPNPRGLPVNWRAIEKSLGVCYPCHFKDFINVYGGCVWFNNLSPFYRQGGSDDEAKDFPSKVERMCDIDRGNTYDANGKPLSPAFYPEEGGLLPFLVDYGGNVYYWDTASGTPEEWLVIQSHGGWMTPFPAMSIPTMILNWLGRDPQMIEMWGDADQISPDRLRITES
jgi:hypothetical protein